MGCVYDCEAVMRNQIKVEQTGPPFASLNNLLGSEAHVMVYFTYHKHFFKYLIVTQVL